MVDFHFDVSDSQLTESLLKADVLIMPSYHEGFCVPVIEALICGCFVICSDAGALPETSGGLGRTFAVGNGSELVERLEEFAQARQQGGFTTDSGFLTAEQWQRRAGEYVAQFSRSSCEDKFRAAVFGDFRKVNDEILRYLGESRRQTILTLREQNIQPTESSAILTRVNEVFGSSGLSVAMKVESDNSTEASQSATEGAEPPLVWSRR